VDKKIFENMSESDLSAGRMGTVGNENGTVFQFLFEHGLEFGKVCQIQFHLERILDRFSASGSQAVIYSCGNFQNFDHWKFAFFEKKVSHTIKSTVSVLIKNNLIQYFISTVQIQYQFFNRCQSVMALQNIKT